MIRKSTLLSTIPVFPKDFLSLSKNTQYVLQKSPVCCIAAHSSICGAVLDDATGCEFDALSVWEASDNAR